MSDVVKMSVDTAVIVCFLMTYGAFVSYYAPEVISDARGAWETIFVGMIIVVAVSIPLFIVGVLPAHNYEADNE